MNTLTEYTPDHITEISPPPPPPTHTPTLALFILDKIHDMKNRWGGLKYANRHCTKFRIRLHPRTGTGGGGGEGADGLGGVGGGGIVSRLCVSLRQLGLGGQGAGHWSTVLCQFLFPPTPPPPMPLASFSNKSPPPPTHTHTPKAGGQMSSLCAERGGCLRGFNPIHTQPFVKKATNIFFSCGHSSKVTM